MMRYLGMAAAAALLCQVGAAEAAGAGGGRGGASSARPAAAPPPAPRPPRGVAGQARPGPASAGPIRGGAKAVAPPPPPQRGTARGSQQGPAAHRPLAAARVQAATGTRAVAPHAAARPRPVPHAAAPDRGRRTIAPVPVPTPPARDALGATLARRAQAAAGVRAAAEATGFDPDLLLAIAMAESSLRAEARNPRSSAAGPLQFTVPTWLAAVHAFADQVPALAAHRARIMALGAREAAVAEAPPRRRRATLAALRREQERARRAALALRHDAAVAARVAVLLARDDAARFRALTGEAPSGPGEIYAIHLLGVGAAAELARAERRAPAGSVAEVLPPGVLAANREIFRGADGQPLTVAQARARIAARVGGGGAAPAGATPAPGPDGTAVVELAQAP